MGTTIELVTQSSNRTETIVSIYYRVIDRDPAD